jgi:hypothetical protein
METLSSDNPCSNTTIDEISDQPENFVPPTSCQDPLANFHLQDCVVYSTLIDNYDTNEASSLAIRQIIERTIEDICGKTFGRPIGISAKMEVISTQAQVICTFDYLNEKITEDNGSSEVISDKIEFLTETFHILKERVKKQLLFIGLNWGSTYLENYAVRFDVMFSTPSNCTKNGKLQTKICISVMYRILNFSEDKLEELGKRNIPQYLLDEFLIDAVRIGDRMEVKYLLKLAAKITDETMNFGLLGKEHSPILYCENHDKFDLVEYSLKKRERRHIYKDLCKGLKSQRKRAKKAYYNRKPY